MKHKHLVVALGLCLLLGATPASAQIARLGQTFLLWHGASRGSDIAYDSRNGVYLAVAAHGAVVGRFVSADGGLIGEPFVLQGAVGFGQFPHVAYSPDANGGNGAFLVSWHESDGPIPSLHVRLVSYPNGLIGPDRKVVGNDTYWEVMGAPIVYSTVSREFLVAWRQYADVNIFAMRLNLAGEPIGGVIPAATSVLFESDPALTYNPQTDEFFLVYRMGFGTASVMGQRIKAGTGAMPPPTVIAQAATINTTDVTYNPSTGQYLAAWHQMPGDAIIGRAVAADGTPVGNAVALSTRYGTYDSLNVDASAASGTTLLVGHDKLSVEDGGAEISGAGQPMSGGLPLTGAGGNGNFYPKVASHTTRGEWLMTASSQFARMVAQRVQTTAKSGGNQEPPPPPPPPPAGSNPKLFLDSPAANSMVQSNFAIAGWAVDLGSAAGGGTGVSTVHAYAFPTSGAAPIFLGASSMGVGRPDIAAYFGRGDFAGAGFGIGATLGPGTYDIVVYAFSTVAGGFNASARARVTVTQPTENPKMFIDSPGQGQHVGGTFAIGGWAVDLGSLSGPGVSVVHVWAYPASGGAPIFFGATGLNIARPDVGAHFGGARFSSSGYSLQGSLPAGSYNLVVFAFSTVSGRFNNAAGVPITVH